MNAKQLKMYGLFEKMCRSELFTAPKEFTLAMNQYADIDFLGAVDVWEYFFVTNEKYLTDKNKAMLLSDVMFSLFYGKSPARIIKAVFDTPTLRSAVFTYCTDLSKGDVFTVMAELLATNKVVQAEEALKCIIKNEFLGAKYGAYMKDLIERVFIELLKKSDSKRVEISKKLAALLNNYIAKIKTDERAMLAQRIKELT